MWGDSMLVFHGSYVEVIKPDVCHSRDNVDFGKGFYVTPIREQAIKWATRFKRNNGKGIVSTYDWKREVISKQYKVLEFAEYSEAWLDFVISCRKQMDNSEYDVVIGGVANDKVFNTIELYFEGLIQKTEAIRRLKYEKPNLQICIRKQEILEEFLVFKESEDI